MTRSHDSPQPHRHPPPNQSPVWRRQPSTPIPPVEESPAARALTGAAGSVDELRAACLAVESALDLADEQLRGSAHPLPRLTLTSWDDAWTQATAALDALRAGLSEARALPGVPPATVDGVITRLRAARREADHAIGLFVPLRRRLIAALDLTRRADASAAARVTANAWLRALERIDRATARLAVGAVALDRYLRNLGDPAAAPATPSTVSTATASPAATAAGARAAGAAVLLRYPWVGWRGVLARVRYDQRRDLDLLKEFLLWRRRDQLR